MVVFPGRLECRRILVAAMLVFHGPFGASCGLDQSPGLLAFARPWIVMVSFEKSVNHCMNLGFELGSCVIQHSLGTCMLTNGGLDPC